MRKQFKIGRKHKQFRKQKKSALCENGPLGRASNHDIYQAHSHKLSSIQLKIIRTRHLNLIPFIITGPTAFFSSTPTLVQVFQCALKLWFVKFLAHDVVLFAHPKGKCHARHQASCEKLEFYRAKHI